MKRLIMFSLICVLSACSVSYKFNGASIDYTTVNGEYESCKSVWVPKSCTMTKEEYEATLIEEKKRFEEGKVAYEKLVAWAKDQGVKGVRVGLRKETILKKINEAGLCYNF